MVDIENTEGGGLPAMERQIKAWWDKYQVDRWVVESNLFGAASQYQGIREFANSRGIHISDFRTHAGNKGSQFFGVTAMAPLFSNKVIVLPNGNTESVEKMEVFAKQFVLWDPASSNRNAAVKSRASSKTDLVMATWFPWNSVIRREIQDHNTEIEMDDDLGLGLGLDIDIGIFETADSVPWTR